MVGSRSTNHHGGIFVLSFVCMLISVALRGAWNILATIAEGRTGTPRFVHVMNYLLCASVVALFMYFKWPWVAVVVSWINAVMVVRGIFPWESHNLIGALQQFKLDVLFFIAAHAGVASYLFNRRKNDGAGGT